MLVSSIFKNISNSIGFNLWVSAQLRYINSSSFVVRVISTSKISSHWIRDLEFNPTNSKKKLNGV